MTTPPWGHKPLCALVDVVKDIPRFFALKIARLTASLHEPFEVGPPDHTWCGTCRKPWPCELFVSATNQIRVLTGASSEEEA